MPVCGAEAATGLGAVLVVTEAEEALEVGAVPGVEVEGKSFTVELVCFSLSLSLFPHSPLFCG